MSQNVAEIRQERPKPHKESKMDEQDTNKPTGDGEDHILDGRLQLTWEDLLQWKPAIHQHGIAISAIQTLRQM
jgi:hypothetical protein